MSVMLKIACEKYRETSEFPLESDDVFTVVTLPFNVALSYSVSSSLVRRTNAERRRSRGNIRVSATNDNGVSIVDIVRMTKPGIVPRSSGSDMAEAAS